MKYILLCCLILCLGCRQDIVSESSPKTLIQGPGGIRLDSLLTPYVERLRAQTDNTAALAIGVTQGNQIIYARVFGQANVSTGRAADLYTRFHLASVSKPFTAVAIARMLQDGQLELDDPIIKHLPEFRMQGPGYAEISIRHILTHTSGIPRNIAIDDWLNPSYGPEALAENLSLLREQQLDFPPGSEFSYSNSAFDLLGLLISRVSGLSFATYVEAHILRPAGMDHSGFTKARDSLPADWAEAHSYGLRTQVLTPFPYNERLFPSSGMVSSLLDMCRWGMIHLGQGSYGDYQVLDETHFKWVVSPQYQTPWEDQIGLSWFLQSYLDRPIIMHTGSDTGFESVMYVYPEQDVSIVVLANRDFSRTARLVNATSEILFGEDPKPYQLSAKYPFATAYRQGGIDSAKAKWEALRQDTLDAYYVDNDDVLTTGAILENGQAWQQAQDILSYYLEFDDQSTYAWRLLGNTHVQLGDTAKAIFCYRKTQEINPDYEKGRIALESLLGQQDGP